MYLNRSNNGHILVVSVISILCLLPHFVLAEELESETLDSTVTYPASFFAQYEPVSANDMLDRIPGVDVGGGNNFRNDNRRGLGAGDNQILINGKRIAGKENDGGEALSRIAAKQVEAIEIIRTTSGDLNIRSSGPIINIILKEGASRNSVSAEINADYHQNDGYVQPGGSISFGGQSGDLNYLASFKADPKYRVQERVERSRQGPSANYAPNDVWEETITRDETDYILSGNFGYQIDDKNSLQLNALYEITDSPQVIERNVTEFYTSSLLPPPPRFRQEDQSKSSDKSKWEFGGNYSHVLTNGNRINAIWVINEDTDNSDTNRANLTSASAINYIGSDNKQTEKILRTSFSWRLNDTQDIELGIEGADTKLESSFRLGLPIQHSGLPGTVPLPEFSNLYPWVNTFTTVEEIRYEPFAIHNWKISSKVSLESTLVAEFSEISSTGVNYLFANPNPLEESFEYWKPKFDFRYDITNNNQLKVTLEREVSQLNFRDFVTQTTGDPSETSSTGNRKLEPEKNWKLEFKYEYRLANDAGVLSSRVFYQDIEDAIDRVDTSNPARRCDANYDPALYPGDNPSWTPDCDSAPGNIGDAIFYGLDLNASVRLGFINLPEALFTTQIFTADSKVTDPFTLEERRLRGRGRGFYSIGFRHDVPKWNFNYGFNVSFQIQGGNKEPDIETFVSMHRDANSSLFLEKVAFDGVRFRLDVMNFLDGDRNRQRTRYVGPRADGVIEEIERSAIKSGRKIALKIRTTF